ncbi:unnamed protein product [Pelagomonas calceolata]|uniref:Uncharacterized protein n=1 Tax=Pelagomonas calceolata TaxID=35677 RepID=A0A7S3ZP27_9STRA|nr:unnamed protein product [Pelagomonas calceolata]|mmetsp:Transcript_3803/g.8793  ORF Transcript_3803/g.8793 Transcript_3803/m.8793 type:complete len:260 (-) Transcript_3803:146-925(-)
MLAALLFLTAPYAAAEIINLDKGSQGSCYDGTTHVVTCFIDNVTCAAMGNTPYEAGFISNYGGCCHCNSNCDHTKETGTDCSYYDTSSGSCYDGSTHAITCDVTQSTCEATTGNVWYAAGTVGSNGCCHCDETCDHSQETGTNCQASYYDESQSDGSCYDGTTHVVTCDVGHADCEALGHAWYAPGYMSGYSGCCHCEESCNHDLETPADGVDCSTRYYDVSPSPTRGPTAAKTVAADAAAATTVGILAAAAAGAAALL